MTYPYVEADWQGNLSANCTGAFVTRKAVLLVHWLQVAHMQPEEMKACCEISSQREMHLLTEGGSFSVYMLGLPGTPELQISWILKEGNISWKMGVSRTVGQPCRFVTFVMHESTQTPLLCQGFSDPMGAS